jgi:hypothetical protein
MDVLKTDDKETSLWEFRLLYDNHHGSINLKHHSQGEEATSEDRSLKPSTEVYYGM